MLKHFIAAITASALLFSLCGCGSGKSRLHADSENAIYHWKSYYSLEDVEREFLYKHGVNRQYIRFFDVVSDYRYGAVPSGSVYLSSAVPKGTVIVPTVFITLEALKAMDGKESDLAENIYQRIMSQLTAERICEIDEIQIDCDWTESTRDSFFALCSHICDLAHKDDIKVSATIRLHQLSQPAPPVDSGVLMVYNVGELKDVNETNSILRADIVKKYISKAPKYPLRLDAAYPIFSWGAVFNKDKFTRLRRIDKPIDSVEGLKLMHDNIYEITNTDVKENILSNDYHETLRYEFVSPETLREVKSIIEKYLGGRPRRVILYHLDDSTIGMYTNNEISALYE